MFELEQRNLATGTGFGGAVAIILLILFLIVIGVIYAALAAVVASGIILAMAKLFDRQHTLSLAEVYSAGFWGLLIYMILTFGAIWLLSESNIGKQALAALPRDPDLMIRHIAKQGPGKSLVLLFIVANMPGLLAFAGIMTAKLGRPYDGIAGYFKAILTSVVATFLSMIFVAWLIVLIVESVQKSGGFVSFATALLFMAVIAFVFATVVALVAGALIMILTRLLAKNRDAGYGKIYGAAFLALLAYALITFVVELLFHGSTKIYNFAMFLAHSKSLWILAERLYTFFVHFFPSFMLMQLPGLLAAALILTIRLAPAYRGVPGYLKSLAVAQSVLLISVCVGFVGSYVLYHSM